MSNKLVWASNESLKKLLNLSEEDLRTEVVDYMGYDEDLVRDMTFDELRSFVIEDEALWYIDQDTFNDDVVPMINRQTADGIVLMVGTAGRWDGDFAAGKAVHTEDLNGSNIDQDVEEVEIIDDGEGLVWLGHHHDATHKFALFALPEENQVEFVKNCMEDEIYSMFDWYYNEENLEEVYDEIMEDILGRLTDVNYLNESVNFSQVPNFCKRIKDESKVSENLEEEVLDEASAKEPKKLAKELKEIKKLADNYGYEYLTAMPFSNFDNDPISIEYNYPEFSKIVKAFFVEMGDMTREEAKTDIDQLDLLWDQNISQHDWDTIIRTCEYLLNHKNAQIEKIYKTGYNSFLDDDQILADREGDPDFEESLQEATNSTKYEVKIEYFDDQGDMEPDEVKTYTATDLSKLIDDLNRRYFIDKDHVIKYFEAGYNDYNYSMAGERVTIRKIENSKDESLKKSTGETITESKHDLPNKLRIDLETDGNTDDEIEQYINDYLSDTYGYLVKNYDWEIIEPYGDIRITNIEWDLDESLNEDIVQSYETMLPGETIDDYIKDAKKYNVTIKKDPDGLPGDVVLSGNREDLRKYYAEVINVDMDDDAVDVISESKFNMYNEESLNEGAAEEIAMHEFKEEIVNYIYNNLLEEVDTNLAPEIASKFGQYDLEWCNDEGDNFEARKIENHKKQLARAIADSLFKYAPKEM